jgi:cytochrome c oxidase subunit 2
MEQRVGDTRDEFSELFNIYWPIGVAVFLIILALMVFVVLRFRSEQPGFPRGVDGRRSVELSYAAFIGLIVAALLYFTYNTMSDIAPADGGTAGELRVDVTAAKWNWRFAYPEQGVVQQAAARRPTTLVVPVGTPVRFRMTATDVMHAFWIPERRFKRDAFPGRITDFTLTFPREGFMYREGQCNQFCGLFHATMEFNVHVVSPAEFRRWAADKRAEGRS